MLLVVAIGLGTALAVDHFRTRALANSERELQNTALLLARHLDQELKQLELVHANFVKHIRSLGVATRDDFERQMNGQDAHLILKNQISAVPSSGRLSVIDADGKLINSSYAWPVPSVDVADRDYFRALKADAQLTTLLSEPVQSRLAGGWTVILAHKVTGSSGEFLGLVVGGIQLAHFEKFFASVTLGKGASITMFTRKGTLLARHPPAPTMIGRNFIIGPLEQHQLFTQEHVTMQLAGRIDGQDRLISARRLDHFPLVVMPTITVSAALADWREQTRALIGLAVLSVVVIGAVLLLIIRQLLREHASAGQMLTLEKERLHTAVSNMVQGLLLFDASTRIVVVNQRYLDMYRLSPNVVKPGCTLRALIEHRKETGSFVGDVGDYCSAILRNVAKRKHSQTIIQSADGRLIQVVDQPLADGGWVCTHEDVSERQRLHTELQQRSEQLDLALTNMSQGLAMFDAEQRVVIANGRFAEMYGQTSEHVKPGMPLREIIAHRIAKGLYVGTTVDEVVMRMRERVARGKVSYMTSRMGDGRTITVSIQPRSDGGWVTTHQDVTEREKLKDRLDAALNNMAQGLAMFDRDQRLVLCNARFAEMYHLSAAESEPGGTVRQLLQRLVENGCYAGRDPDKMLASTVERLGAKVMGYYMTTLTDGHVYGVSVMPMSHGGFVTTHEDITERRRIEARMAYLAHHDALTDLPNRVLLRQRLEQTLLSSARDNTAVAVLCLDLDRFKEVNDTLGHAVGDELLKAVATRLRGTVRENELVARLGGDEFAVVITTSDPPRDAAALAGRIMEALTAPHIFDGHQLTVGTSIGIAVAPSDGSTAEHLLRSADLALYGAKGDGRGAYRFFEPEMNTRMQARRALETDLRKALEEGQLALNYQPLINLERDEVCGCEALLRWDHPQRGPVPPADFIPVAEAAGLIVPIGEWVLREACHEAKAWPDAIKVAVNLSALQFKSPTIVQTVVSALSVSGLSPERLELEITESVLLSDSKMTLEILRQLRALGVRIALDDFGTGYSSLSYLHSFPFDKIKIDRCFVSDIAADNQNRLAILRTITQLGRSLGIATTAEGVETHEQLALVRSEGCTEMQGYLFSPPIYAEDLRQLLSRQHTLGAHAA